MRNSVILKFLALLLCAAALLGAVSSGLGILVLSETGLYTQTVDQMVEERIQTEGSRISRNIALRYASTELGGCPERFVDRQFPDYGGFFRSYGFELVDAQGNVVKSANVSESGQVYDFPVTGQYMYLLSQESEQERYPGPNTDPASYTKARMDGNAYLYCAVPPEGAAIGGILFELSDGSSHDVDWGNVMGTIYYTQGGQIACLFTNVEFGEMNHETVTYVRIMDIHQGLLYEASAPAGVGYFTHSMGSQMFLSTLMAGEVPTETTEVTVPETIPETSPATQPETIPVTVPETLPEESVAETTEVTLATEETTEDTVVETSVPSSASAFPEETAVTEPEETEPVIINGKALEEYEINQGEYYDHSISQNMYVRYVYVPMPEYTVKLYWSENDLLYGDLYDILETVRHFRQYLLPVLGACLLTFVILAVYLCCAAGRRPKSQEIRAGGMNRIPLDLYFGLGCFAVTGLIFGAVEGGQYFLRQNLLLGIACAGGCGFAACLLVVGFLFACVAQGKTPDGFWWRNSLCGRSVGWFLAFGRWLEKFLGKKGFPFVGRLLRKLWKLSVALVLWIYRTTEKLLLWAGRLLGRLLGRMRILCRWMTDRFSRFLSLLPVIWQWLIIGTVMILMLFITVAGRFDFGIVLSVILSFAMVIYGAECFGILWESTRNMSKGDLDTKVDDRLMVGAFKEFAGDLNDLADVAVVAAQKQLKSERMKTELITNVSHDIKTPLTSIINYVDLLQKPHTEEEAQQYLEVLDRQSQRLKKLIEDLMEMSKASTGNMSVEITRVDAVESINQALGEFSDKLDRAQLIPVFRHTEESVTMMADGSVNIEHFVTNKIRLEDYRLGLDLARSRPEGFVKAVFCDE